MGRTAAAAAGAALCLLSALAVQAHLEFGNYKNEQLANEVVSMLVVGDWGGQSAAPYTTPGQLSVASAMASVATSSLSTFVVSPGGNFYGDGIQGAQLRGGERASRLPLRAAGARAQRARAARRHVPRAPPRGCTPRAPRGGSFPGGRGPRPSPGSSASPL